MENQVLSIEQMQELQELGIDISKASCCWCKIESLNRVGFVWRLLPEHIDKCDEKHVPTFTLQDILEILPLDIDALHKIYPGKGYGRVIYSTFMCYEYYDDFLHQEVISRNNDGLLTAAFNMLKWCKLNNYI